jgi:ABC-type dipeptide/oligopeptide/nickel transport system permease component
MSTSQQPHSSGSAPTVLMRLGSVFMLLAVIFSVALFIWGHSGPSSSQNWHDLAAAAYIVLFGLPAFVIGLLLLLIGVVLRARRKAGR